MRRLAQLGSNRMDEIWNETGAAIFRLEQFQVLFNVSVYYFSEIEALIEMIGSQVYFYLAKVISHQFGG